MLLPYPPPHSRNSCAIRTQRAGRLVVSVLLALSALSLLAGPAIARPFDDTPCAKDANELCAGERPASRPIRKCLDLGVEAKKVESACAAHLTQLDADRKAAAMKKKAQFWEFCREDVDKHCAEFSQNRFTAARCLGHRRDELSEQCLAHMPKSGSARAGFKPGSVLDPSESDEARIARAEARRPGVGGDQMRRKLMLQRMSEEERQAFLAKERAEGVPSPQAEAQSRIESMMQPKKPAPQQITDEEREARRLKREAEREARQAKWAERRAERLKRQQENTQKAQEAVGEAASSTTEPDASESGADAPSL